ncbi:MAG: NUDIX domain-containing protein [Dehalococcoidia bacterium]
MARYSAGLLMYRIRDAGLEVLLVHPGGPYWARKDEGAWSIPKGEYQAGEDPFEVAKREFQEETGIEPEGNFVELSQVRQPGGKKVTAWAFEGDCDPVAIRSNTFTMEWPPHTGKQVEFPEVDRADWFKTDVARRKIQKGQVNFIDQLCELIRL